MSFVGPLSQRGLNSVDIIELALGTAVVFATTLANDPTDQRTTHAAEVYIDQSTNPNPRLLAYA